MKFLVWWYLSIMVPVLIFDIVGLIYLLVR